MRIGVAHHLGWALLVGASDDHVVVDRRRVELVTGDLPAAHAHHRGGAHAMHSTDARLDDDELAALVAVVPAHGVRAADDALDLLVRSLEHPVASISLHDSRDDFPTAIAVQRRPFESQADSVMYRQIFAERAEERGWKVHRFDGARIEAEAAHVLGEQAHAVLYGPRTTLGPPWNSDHRMALAATVIAARSR